MIEFKDNRSEGGFLVPEYLEEPINKWQAFKWRYFPFWLQRIFPVKTHKTHLPSLFKEMLNKND